MSSWFSVSSKHKTFAYRCAECGAIHRGAPSFAVAEPQLCAAIPEDEREARVRLSSDLCVVDDETFFIRGVLELPIHGAAEPFTLGNWVSQSRESFERYVQTFDQDQSGDRSFGWLVVAMPGYTEREPDGKWPTLACDVHWRGVGDRPLIVPHECDHPLYHDCVDGIAWDRAVSLARLLMHG